MIIILHSLLLLFVITTLVSYSDKCTAPKSFTNPNNPVHAKIISRQLPGSYSRAYVGIFATSNGDETNNFADFHNFTYKNVRFKQ